MKAYVHKHFHLTHARLVILLQKSLHRKFPLYCHISPVPPYCGNVGDIKMTETIKLQGWGFLFVFNSHIIHQKKISMLQGFICFCYYFLFCTFTPT